VGACVSSSGEQLYRIRNAVRMNAKGYSSFFIRPIY